MAISRTTRYARYRQDERLEISLFPFLSIFLCVMGVLSFINILNSFSTPKKVELTAQLEQSYKVAYQIFSLPDGVISIPPTEQLSKLKASAINQKDKLIIDIILQRRQETIQRLKSHKGLVFDLASDPSQIDILRTIDDIRQLNEIALKANILYEEFLLFGIYPNSGSAYHKYRDVMTLTSDSAAIDIGLEPLDNNWTLNLNTQKVVK